MNSIQEILMQFPYFGLVALLILGGFGLPFPEDATLILCGFLIAGKVVEPVPSLLLCFTGLMLVDIFLYLAGKKYGRKVVTHPRLYKIVKPDKLKKIEGLFKKWGIFVILVGRHIVGVRSQILIIAGVLKMPFSTFLISDAISSIITMAIMVSIGYVGGNSIDILRRDFSRIDHIVIAAVIVIVLLIIIWIYGRSNKRK
jgi:membrane protein DedA with SNARE-associated domain